MSFNSGRKLKNFLTVFSICGAFLFVLSVKNALATQATSTYTKQYNGTLEAADWNGLFVDFVNTWTPTSLLGPLGINTSTPIDGTRLDVNGVVRGLSFLGTLNSSNVASGNFGANTGGGNYNFPGYVGIGTTNPGSKLDLVTQNANAFPLIARYDGTGGGTANKFVVYPFSDGNTYLQHDGKVVFAPVGSVTPQLVIDTTGNVGISTTTPAYKLDVNGQINSSNGLCIAGDCRTNWAAITGAPAYWNLNGTSLYASSTSYKVGIGTTNPSYPLDIYNTSAGAETTALRLRNNSGTAGTAIAIGFSPYDGDVLTGKISNINRGGVYDLAFSNWDGAGNIEHLRILSNGKVGIGTSDPKGTLHVSNASSTNALVVATSGNVGVGTTNPGATLDVNGINGFRNNYATTHTLLGNAGNVFVMADNNGTLFGTSTSAIVLPIISSSSLWMGTKNGNIWNGDAGAGNVGIGTTTPANKLSIWDTNPTLEIGTNANPYTGGSATLLFNSKTTGYPLAKIVGTDLSGGGTYRGGLSFYTNVNYNSLAERMRIDENGNVGVGSTNPATKLDVLGSAATRTVSVEDEFHLTRPTNAGVSNPQLAAFKLGTYSNTGTNPQTRLDIALKSNGDNTLTADSNVMTLLDTGSVGIGTTYPGTTLELRSGNDNIFRLRQIGGGWNYMEFYNDTARTLWMGMRSDSIFSINDYLVINSGQVGIGTTNPGVTLDVVGANGLRNNGVTTHTLLGGAGNLLVATDNNGTLYGTSTTALGLDLWKGAKNGNIYNGDAGAGNVGIGTTNPTAKLDILGGNIDLDNTTFANQFGVITKNGSRFIHDFTYGNNGTATPDGHNTFIGINAGNFTMGSTATAGHQSSNNTGIGYYALNANTLGEFNVAIGANALQNNTTGSLNLAIGASALSSNTTGSSNMAFGFVTLSQNTTGTANIAVGPSALSVNTTGSYNNAFGSGTLAANKTGGHNVAIGRDSLTTHNAGDYNVAMGAFSLNLGYLGDNNTAIGSAALYGIGKTITAGSFVTGVSYTIVSPNDTDFTLIGAANSNAGTVFTATGPGTGTGTAANSSSNNVGLGYNAGRSLADGVTTLTAPSNSVFVGYNSKANADGQTNQIVIGYNAIGSGSNTVTLGNSSILKTILQGSVGIGTTNPGATLDVNGINGFRNNYATTHSLLGSAGNVVVMSDNNGTLYGTSTSSFISGNSLDLWKGTKNGNIYNGDAGAGNVGVGTISPASKLEVDAPNQTLSGSTNTAHLSLLTTDAQGADIGGALGLGGYSNTAKTLFRNFGVIAGRKENSTDGDSSGYLSFSTHLTAVGLNERMRITSGGNVGIGTTNPIYHFESRGGSAGGQVALFEGNNFSDGTGASFAMSGASYNGMFSIKNKVGAYDAGINLIQDGISADRTYSILNQASSGNLLINTDAINTFGSLATTNLVTISSSGKVGIGVTNPASELQVKNGATSGYASIEGNIAVGDVGTQSTPGFFGRFQNSGDTGAGGSYYTYFSNNAKHVAGQDFLTYHKGNGYIPPSVIAMGGDGKIRFLTSQVGEENNPNVDVTMAERMTILQGGSVGIGTTNPGAMLDVNGLNGFRNNYATTHSSLGNSGNVVVMADNSGTLYGTSTASFMSSNGLDLWKGTKNGNIYNGDAGAGNVGIGITNPGAKLTVSGTDNRFRLNYDGNASTTVDLISNASGQLRIFPASGSTYLYGGGVKNYLYTYDFSNSRSNYSALSSDLLALQNTSNLTTVSINASGNSYFNGGNIGIGTTNPTKLLTIGGTGGVDGTFLVRQADNSEQFSIGAGVVNFNGQGGYTTAGGVDLGARFNIQPVNDTRPTLSIKGNQYSSSNVSDIFRVSSYNQTTGDYFIIKANGLVGIGTTNPGVRLDVPNATDSFRAYSAAITGLGNGGSVMVMADNNGNLFATSTNSFINSNSLKAVYVGKTTVAYDGSNNSGSGGTPGYTYANDRCSSTVSTGSHVCSSMEMLNTVLVASSTLPTEDVWIVSGPPGYTASANDCIARTSVLNDANTFGAIWQGKTIQYPEGRGLLKHCNEAAKLACCK